LPDPPACFFIGVVKGRGKEKKQPFNSQIFHFCCWLNLCDFFEVASASENFCGDRGHKSLANISSWIHTPLAPVFRFGGSQVTGDKTMPPNYVRHPTPIQITQRTNNGKRVAVACPIRSEEFVKAQVACFAEHLRQVLAND
jgi:hypothetical protein